MSAADINKMVLESQAIKDVQKDMANVKNELTSVGKEISGIKQDQSSGFENVQRMLTQLLAKNDGAATGAAAA
eukprot:10454879-Karenia_brevis.AAC.1